MRDQREDIVRLETYACCHEARPIRYQTHQRHAETPENPKSYKLLFSGCWQEHVHDDGYENGGSETLQQHVREGFENGVRDEEDRKGRIVHAS